MLKRYYLVSFVLTVTTSTLSAQELSAWIHFADANGKRDSVHVGPDRSGQLSDGRSSEQAVAGRQLAASLVSNPQRNQLRTNPKTIGGDGDCEDTVLIVLRAARWPVKITWDANVFARDTCLFDSEIGILNTSGSAQAWEDWADLAFDSTLTIHRNPHGLTSASSGIETRDTAVMLAVIHKRSPRVPGVYDPDHNIPGWLLIFNDEFDLGYVDPIKWNISSPNDDMPSGCPGQSWNVGVATNPGNVSVDAGKCIIRVTDEDFDGCNFSGGEIKTFSVTDPYFLGYRFPSDCRVQIKAQLPALAHGVGSAGWLYDCNRYNEIDIWETHGRTKDKYKSWYGSTYHYWHRGPTICDLDAQICAAREDRIKCKDLNGKPLDLTATWPVLEMIWTPDYISSILNGVETARFDMHKTPRQDGRGDVTCRDGYQNRLKNEDKNCANSLYDPPTLRKAIRIGAGHSSLGESKEFDIIPAELPKELLVDYVRVWKKEGTNVTEMTNVQDQICVDGGPYGGMSLWCSHYPEVDYKWSSSAFEVIFPDSSMTTPHPSHSWAVLKADLEPDRYYPLTLTATFPGFDKSSSVDDHQEVTTKNIWVAGTTVPVPTGPISMTRQDCYYYAGIMTSDAPASLYEWQITEAGGTSSDWLRGVPFQDHSRASLPLCPGVTYNVKVRMNTACGVGEEYMETFTPPSHHGCGLCPLLADSEVSILIHDLMGRFVAKSKSDLFRSGLPNGVYIISLHDAYGSLIRSEKFLIIR